MHYLLFVGVFLWFAFMVPLTVTLATIVLLILIAGVVRSAARWVVGVQPSMGEAAKAVGLSFFFLAIALFTQFSFIYGTSSAGLSVHITGLASWFLLAATLSSYVLGYKLSLDTSFGASAVIATISTAASAALFVIYKAVI